MEGLSFTPDDIRQALTACGDEPRRYLGNIDADYMGEALQKASEYWEVPSHDLVAEQITKNTLFK